MESAELNNVEYAYKIHQQNNELPYLLMLHGFMGDHRVFDHLADELSDFCNPVALDLLGFGSSSKPTSPDRYHEQMQISDICSLIDKLDASRIFLFGYSMGGRLALKTAIEGTPPIKGLILESTTCGITNPADREKRQKKDASRAKEIEDNFEDFLSEWKNIDLFKSPISVDKPLAQKYWKIQSEQHPKAVAASLLGFGTGSMQPVCNKLKQFGSPTLLLAGSADVKYQQINEYLSEHFPNATFSSIKAGHRTHLDNPSALISELKHFIDINTFL